MKHTVFVIVRHAEVDKKHPLGESAPLTENGVKQAKELARKCKNAGVGLAVLPTEDLPRFSQAAAEMEAVGIRVKRVDGISFKNMKGQIPIREIAAKYREAGLTLVFKLLNLGTVAKGEKVVIIGSYPLIAGLRYDPATATDEELETKPDFCTGIVVEIASNGMVTVTSHDFCPLDD
ncbi:MAG: histidine phosphatase family protein [Candidatus Magasanikbacteria bacterium]|nr:histidine phosphatase family protein [Candidatus Magasanikbacteria bacterium]